MFAYCNNNPVCCIDPSGCVSDFITGVSSKFGLLTDYGLGSSGGGGICGYPIRKKASTTNEALNPGNTDEQVVLDAEYFAFYKGVPFVKLPIGKDAFSFGIVFIGDEVGSRTDPKETVMHEYGHSVHFTQIGPLNYLNFVAIPSLIGYWTNVETAIYYSQPYEYIADRFGGVERYYYGSPYPYSSATENWWWIYWAATVALP